MVNKFLKIAVAAVLSLVPSTNVLAVPADEEKKWLKDLEAYSTNLEASHIDLFHKVSRMQLRASLNELKSKLAELTEPEIVAALMHITHGIGDGHTAMPLWNAGYHRFPVRLRLVGGKAIITAASPANRSMLGATITHWDGTEIGTAFERLAPYVPFAENKFSTMVRAAAYMPVAELSHAIGLSKSPQSIKLRLEKNGVPEEVVLVAVNSGEYRSSLTEKIDYRRDLSNAEGLVEAEGLRFALIEDESIGYIQFDRYPQAREMRNFMGRVRRALERTGTENLVIDFRENFGGDFFVGLLLASNLITLDSLDWRNGIYVLTSGTTFSAAMSNSAQFADILNARLVGTPTGANPCGYQDMGQFELPNSGHIITYSKRYYCFARAEADALLPDVQIDMQHQDFVEKRDRALDWIINDIKK